MLSPPLPSTPMKPTTRRSLGGLLLSAAARRRLGVRRARAAVDCKNRRRVKRFMVAPVQVGGRVRLVTAYPVGAGRAIGKKNGPQINADGKARTMINGARRQQSASHCVPS